MASVRQQDGLLLIDAPAVQAKYSGRFIESEARIEGRLTQRGTEFPLVLAAGIASVGPRRPQEPSPPWLYRSEEVSFISSPSKVRLAGTLTLPQGSGPFAAVVLIKGSGPLDRDEAILGHKPFWVLADALARRGVAVLPYRPDTTLAKIHCPVLALNGSKDLQVPASLNLPAIKAALSKDSDVTVEELPGLNHLFQTADKDLPSEYGHIEETIAPTALKLVAEWVVSHSR